MALFTDGIISSAEDLAAQDSSVMAVAATEGIDVSQKARLAQEEIGVELMAVLPRAGAAAGASVPDLACVVVTPPLRLWHVFHTLALVYRDAYNTQLNDRYQGRWEEYKKLGKWAASRLMESGIGMTADPVPQAGAPVLSIGPEPGAGAEVTFYARIAWVNGRGEEGAPGRWNMLVVPPGNSLVVGAGTPPEAAKGWNVYLGSEPNLLARQNTNPIGKGQSWMQDGLPASDGPAPGDGQRPGFLRALPRILQRG